MKLSCGNVNKESLGRYFAFHDLKKKLKGSASQRTLPQPFMHSSLHEFGERNILDSYKKPQLRMTSGPFVSDQSMIDSTQESTVLRSDRKVGQRVDLHRMSPTSMQFTVETNSAIFVNNRDHPAKALSGGGQFRKNLVTHFHGG